ncbi:outer membrane beta-barrel protein [uncultured Enterovirga sp.]|uniref:outer membrane beta-barrel protein n=1 Tax=uncultured Enterovirga sp. TaxID=2026352 RepID=UPI0035CAF120
MLFGASALALAFGLAGVASGQESEGPSRRPFGETGSGAGSAVAEPGLRLPPGLTGNGTAAGSAPATTATPTTGSAKRPGPRDNRGRRSRLPAVAPVQGAFRSTLIAPEVAANVQPVQTGLPDPALPEVPARRRPPADDPYAPLGIRVGNINLFPVIGQAIGYDSNPNRTDINRRGSFVSQTEGELRVQSDWSNNELSGFLRGAYNEYPSNPEASRPEGAGRLAYRVDASRDTQFDVEGHYQIDTQRPGSPDLNAVVRERPIVYTEGASAGVTHRFNRVIASLRGTIDRADYDDAKLTNGTTIDQSDRNLTSFGVRGRLGYEVTPGLMPFAEAFADTRRYDRKIDSSGFARSSDGIGGAIGTTFELTRLLTGEVSAGATQRSYQDARLRELTSPVANASLAYAFSPITTVRAGVQLGVDETTVPNATGIRTARGTLEVSHDFRRNLTVTAGLTGSDYEYQGVSINERSFGALLRADYRLNRQVALRASYNYETLSSTVAGSSYSTNVFLLGIRLQP